MTGHYLLINPDISANTPLTFVIGASGKKWGKSTFQRNLARLGIKGVSYGHVAKLTVEQYEAGAADISLTGHRRGNRWIAKFVVESDVAPEVQEFEAGFNLATEGRDLPDAASPAAKSGWEIAVWKQEAHKAGPTGGGEETLGEPVVPTEGLVDPTIPPRIEIPVEGGVISMPLNRGYTVATNVSPVPYTAAWFAAVKEAKSEGLNPDDFTGEGRKTRLIDAINTKRASQPAGV